MTLSKRTIAAIRRRRAEDVARRCLLATIAHLDYFQACPFCEAGEPDDNGGDKIHTEECPLQGYDWTDDVEALRAWATSERRSTDR